MNLFIDELEQRSQEELDFLMTWYQRDENAIPLHYILKVFVCESTLFGIAEPFAPRSAPTRAHTYCATFSVFI